MKKKTITMGTLSLLALSAVAAVASAYAYQGDPAKVGPNYTPERHAQIQEAFTKNDYNTWKDQMGNRGVTQRINENNFSRFAEMHKLMLAGKTDEANVIRVELGLNKGGYQNKGQHKEMRGENKGGHFIDANGDGQCDNLK